MAIARHSFKPGPEALDLVAMDVDPVGAGYWRLVPLGRDRRLSPQVADVLAKGVAAVAPVGHHPPWHPRQPVEQRHRVGQFVGLSWRQHEGYGAAETVGEDAGLGPKAATRTAKCLTMVSLCRSITFLAAPAALWWARMFVPSRNVMPS